MEASQSSRRRPITYGRARRKPKGHRYGVEKLEQDPDCHDGIMTLRKRRCFEVLQSSEIAIRVPGQSVDSGSMDYATLPNLTLDSHRGVDDMAISDQAVLDRQLGCDRDDIPSEKYKTLGRKPSNSHRKQHGDNSAPDVAAAWLSASHDQTCDKTPTPQSDMDRSLQKVFRDVSGRRETLYGSVRISGESLSACASMKSHPENPDPSLEHFNNIIMSDGSVVEPLHDVESLRHRTIDGDLGHDDVTGKGSTSRSHNSQIGGAEGPLPCVRPTKSGSVPLNTKFGKRLCHETFLVTPNLPASSDHSGGPAIHAETAKEEGIKFQEMRELQPRDTPVQDKRVFRRERVVDRLKRYNQRTDRSKHLNKGDTATTVGTRSLTTASNLRAPSISARRSSRNTSYSDQEVRNTVPHQRGPSKPKLTYASQRSYLDYDVAILHQSMVPLARTAVKAKRALTVTSASKVVEDGIFDLDHEEKPGGQTTSLRTVHELRKAGNISRLTNEVEDLLEESSRGSLSERRSRLLTFVTKFKDTSFRDIFLGKELFHTLFGSMVPQDDLILDLLIVTAGSFVTQETMPSICLRLLSSRAYSMLLTKLLRTQEPLSFAKHLHQSHISKAEQTGFQHFFDDLRLTMAWSFGAPVILTGRTLALQSLNHIVRRNFEQCSSNTDMPEFALCALWDIILALGSSVTPENDMIREAKLSLSILGYCSLGLGKEAEQKPWIMKSASAIMRLLEYTNHPLHVHDYGLVMPALKLGLDLAQNNSIFSESVATLGVICNSAACIVGTLYPNTGGKEPLSSSIDRTILNMGFLINVVECSVTARRQFLRQGLGNLPLVDQLLRAFENWAEHAGEVFYSLH